MSSHNEKNMRAYDKKADNYDNTFDGRFTERFKKALLSAIDVSNGDSVLDIGCGNGTLLSRLSNIQSIAAFGVDISPKMIENAKAHYPGFNFTVSDCENVPLADDSMDIIVVCAAYHHFPNTNAFALEAKRLLKQGGSIYIAEFRLPVFIRYIANIFLPLSKDGDVKLYSSKEIVTTFSGLGFYHITTTKKAHIQIVHLQKTD
jgi:Methylase involved in ubiquinone/menaquinone biosynthesis